MESLTSTTKNLQTLESQLGSLTLQNNINDLMTIINDYNEKYSLKNKKSDKKSAKQGKHNEEDLTVVVQLIIQKQIKNYIDKIESNLKKYWYTDMEAKLYTFLTDLKTHWDFFESFFQVDESFDYLEDTIYAYILDLKKQRSQMEIEELLEYISNSFDYWPNQKAQHCLELAKFLERKDEIEHSLFEIQKRVILYNIENCSETNELSSLPKKFPLLQNSDNNSELIKIFNKKLRILEKQDILNETNSSLEILEETIVRGGSWERLHEQTIINKLILLDQENIQDVFKKIILLVKLYYSEHQKGKSIVDLFPELDRQHQLIPIDITYEGIWSLELLYKGRWISGYRLKELPDFSDVEFKQEGEWKNRKFKCFSWDLAGSIPQGVILKLKNKKEVIYLITTNNKSNNVRDVNLTPIDENLIKNYTDNRDSSLHLNDDKNLNHFTTEFENRIAKNSQLLKLSLKIISQDKNRITKISTELIQVIRNKSSDLKSILDKTKDDKFIRFMEKLLVI